jgi:integrase
MSVHQLEQPARKMAKRTARRTALTDKVCAKIERDERVLDHQAGFYAIGLAPSSDGRARVAFWAKADVPAAARQWGQRTIERAVGKWPDDISPREARLKAAKFVALIKEGVDPTARRAAPAAGWTLQEAIDNYLIKVERDGAVEGSLTQYRAAFKRVRLYKNGKWLKRPIRSVIADGEGLRELHAFIRADLIKRKGGDNEEETVGMNSADDTVKALARVSNYARGKDQSLPAWNEHAVDLFGQRTREESGMGLDEVASWWVQVKTIRNPMRRELALFQLLTGLRMTDARTALKHDLNEEKRTLFLPKPKGHNPKKRRNRAFTLPLSDAAMASIHRARALPRRKHSDLLFPNPNTGKPFSSTKLVRGEEAFASGHRLRHTLANIGADLGIPDETLGRLTNHKPKSQTGKYIDPDKVTMSPREASNMISAAIMERIKL